MYTVKEASEKLGVSPRRVNALIAAGELEAHKFGGAWAIEERSVEDRLNRPRLLGRPKGGEKDSRNLEAYTLMNKNHAVADFVYNKKTRSVVELTPCKDVRWQPLGIGLQGKKPNRYDFEEWLRHRYIPSVRPNLNRILSAQQLAYAADLMFASWGLNLSDHYWFKPQNAQADWHDINYFENGFSTSFGKTLLGGHTDKDFDLRTPDSATPGALPKRWEQRGNDFLLIKGASTHEDREPYNETLATELMGRLLDASDFVPYVLETHNDRSYSTCPTMIDLQSEFIPYADVRTHFGIAEGRASHEQYLRTGTTLGIFNMQAAIDKMLVCDYLMANFDRHAHNFGLLRNADSLDDYRVAPLFDNGAAFFSRANTQELTARPYTWVAHPFLEYPTQQLELVEDISWYDPERLRGFLDDMTSMLSDNPNLSKSFIEASVAQTSRLISKVNDLYYERSSF